MNNPIDKIINEFKYSQRIYLGKSERIKREFNLYHGKGIRKKKKGRKKK